MAAGWVSLVSTASSLGADFVVGIISLWHSSYEPARYHVFLVYLGFTIGALFLNIFAVRLLPLIDRTALMWSIGGAVVVMITILSTAAPDYQPASFTFGNFTNETGWPAGFAFILGLLQSTFGLTGFDGISHIVDEMPSPGRYAPRVMVAAVCMGAGTSWIFLVVLLFCAFEFFGQMFKSDLLMNLCLLSSTGLKDLSVVIESSTGPLLQIYYQATSSKAGA